MEKITRSGKSFHDFKKDADVGAFPDAFSKYVMSFGETYFWEKGNFHVITRASDAKQILTSPDYTADRGAFFVSRMPNMDLSLIQDFFGVVKKMMVMSDDEDHAKRRKVASMGFEEHILEAFRSKMDLTIKEIIEDIKGKKEFEFVEAVSKKLPSSVLAELFSIPKEDRSDFLKWSNIMTGFFGGASAYRNEDGIEVNSAALSLKKYFTKLVEERTVNPGEDYVSIVLQMQKVLNLSHDEVISQLIMMLVAGMATTTDQINNCMFLLASNLDIQKEIRSNPGLIPGALEELKRFDPAVTFIFRLARQDTFVGTQPVKKGDVMFISTHAINRDMPESEKPFELNITRKAQNFAYGHGPHYCIGARLARMEMTSLFERIIEEIPFFEVDTTKRNERDHYSLSFSGFKSLHLRVL